MLHMLHIHFFLFLFFIHLEPIIVTITTIDCFVAAAIFSSTCHLFQLQCRLFFLLQPLILLFYFTLQQQHPFIRCSYLYFHFYRYQLQNDLRKKTKLHFFLFYSVMIGSIRNLLDALVCFYFVSPVHCIV